MAQNVRRLDRYRELVLAIVFLVIASQELLEMWLLEPRGASTRMGPLSIDVLLHLAQVIAVLAATYIFIRAWQQRTALMDREVARSRELADLVAALREKEEALARTSANGSNGHRRASRRPEKQHSASGRDEGAS